jgi:hypothetical protein
MSVAQVRCASCGAPIQIPPDVDRFSCSFCGANLVAQRSEGHVTAQLAAQVCGAIQQAEAQTQSAIREDTYVTQAELKKLELGQELSADRIQLVSIQSEIRSLRRLKRDPQVNQQLRELGDQESALLSQIGVLENSLAPTPSPTPVARPAASAQPPRPVARPAAPAQPPRPVTPPAASAPSRRVVPQPVATAQPPRPVALPSFNPRITRGILSGCLVYVLGAVICQSSALWLDQAASGIKAAQDSSAFQTGPLVSLALCLCLLAALGAFVVGYSLDNPIWNPAKERLGKTLKQRHL